MKSKKKINIEDVDIRLLEKKTIDEIENGKASLTHYAQNYKAKESKYFKKDAEKFVKKVLEFKYPSYELNHDLVLDEIENYVIEFERKNIPFPEPKEIKFKFIDLFAGIGGFRIALQNLGGKCVYSSEWDKSAQYTYELNFGDVPYGDITKEEVKNKIPDNFDILAAGFPCQAFSIAGKRGGFEDTRGTLFFDTAEIIKRKKPKAIFLENVKGLLNHDKGKTLETILNVLRNDLNYFIPEPKIINAKDFGVPQNRQRIYIVGFRKDLKIDTFEYPEPVNNSTSFINIREKNEVSAKYYLSTQYLKTLREHKRRHASKGNGFGYEIIQDDETANAIVVGGMGRERNLVIDTRIKDFTPVTKIKGVVNREGIRRMTPREWARLQGFPDSFKLDIADASAYKQLGNSVAIPAIQATAKKILEKLNLI
jgi:DNA (cytosine-5)-methyltransferase 1